MDEELTFAKWLRQQRRVLDLTQKELAEAASCAPITVRKMEAGELRPSKMLARSLAGVLEIPLDEVEAFIAFARSDNNPLGANIVPKDSPRPWLAAEQKAINFPAPPTLLIGRDHDRSAIRGLFSQPEVRLVTIVGPPGVGKTSLAISLAHELHTLYKDGCTFVELADLQEVSSVPQAIAAAFNLRPSAGWPLVEQLRMSLREQEMILVLDNFEHLLAAASSIFSLLQGCPRLKILATSRASLQLTLEYQYPLYPLLLPPSDHHQTANKLAEYPAIALFISRAKMMQPDFVLSEDNAADVAAICRRLDGLPLAIELAVTKIGLMPPAQLLSQLEEHSSSLHARFVDLPQRQRSLKIAINWSYELLTDREKTVFASMAVFKGGCTLAAAGAVIGGVFDTQVADILTSLFDKNLLVRKKRAASSIYPRITMFKTIYDFALSKLAESSFKEEVKERHAVYFLDLAQSAESELRGPNQIMWLDRLESEHQNFREAIRWALETGRIEVALGLTGALARYWELRSHLEEGQSLLKKAVAESDRLGARAALSRSHKTVLAKALRGASALAQNQGHLDQANRWGQESLALWRALGDKNGEAGTLHTLGLVAQGQQDLRKATEYHQACLHLSQELQDEVRTYTSLYNLAEIAFSQLDYDLAERLHLESLALKEKHGDLWSISWSQFCLGKLAAFRGDGETAVRLYRESFQLRQQLGDKEAMAESLIGFAHVAQNRGFLTEAACLLGGADKLLEASGGALSPQATELYQRSLVAVERVLDSESLSVCFREGRSISIEANVSNILCKLSK